MHNILELFQTSTSPVYGIVTASGQELPFFNGNRMLLMILLLTIAVNYISVFMVQFYNEKFQAKCLIKEFIKKLGYLMIVMVAELGDLGIESIAGVMEFNYSENNGLIVIVVSVWVIVTELIATLKNISDIGLPLPNFLVKMLKLVKSEIEEKAGDEEIE